MTPLPDAERVVTTYLRAQPTVAALVGQRVYTEIPKGNDTWPLVRVTRIGGAPPHGHTHAVDQALLQVEVFGGPKATTHHAMAAVRAALADMRGHLDTPAGATVAWVSFGSLAYLPDDTYTPARPRYLTDVTVTLTPA